MKTLKALTLSVVSLISALSIAGGMEGGGGAGVRCGSELELLEIHEAKIRGVELRKAPRSEETAIKLVSKLAGEVSWTPFFESKEEYSQLIEELIIEPIFKGQNFLAGFDENGNEIIGTIRYVSSLPLSNDYGNYQIRENCNLEQIAYFEDGKNPVLKIVKSAWDKLDYLSRSILVAHETLYASERAEGSIRDLARVSLGKNSEWARKYLIKMFSIGGVTGVSAGLPMKGEYAVCTAYVVGDEEEKSTQFFAHEPGSSLTLIFDNLLDRSEFYQVRSKIRGFTLNDLLNITSMEKKMSAELVYVDADVSSGLIVELEKTAELKIILRVFDISSGERLPIGKSQTISCDL